MNLLAGLLVALTPAPQPASLADVAAEAAELKKQFNAAQGCVRVALIVSPG